MSELTVEELEAVRLQLHNEENLIRQCTLCARNASDPQLRALFEQAAASHKRHWEVLENLLKSERG